MLQWHLKKAFVSHSAFAVWLGFSWWRGCMDLAVNHRCSSDLFLYILFLEQWAIWYMTYLRRDLLLSSGPVDICFLMPSLWTHKVSLSHPPYIVKTSDIAKPLNNSLQSLLFSKRSVEGSIGSLNNNLIYHNSYRNIFLIIFHEIDIFVQNKHGEIEKK